jgi:glycosyltransferase involved in cell wall biosynthesis
MKKVSIVITTKNRASFFHRAFLSAINQTYRNIEIVCVDDCSQNYYAKKECIAHCNALYIRNTTSLGACSSRNIGIINSTGDFIAGLDDDDTFHSERIEKMIKAYSDNFSFICSHSKIINKKCTAKEKHKKNIIYYDDILKTNYVGSQVLVKKQRLIDAGLFDTSLVASQDHDMWCRLIKKYGPALKLNDYLYNSYCDHDLERISSKKILGLLQFYFKHQNDMQLNHKLYNFARLLNMSLNKISCLL